MTVLLPRKLKGKHQFCQGVIPICLVMSPLSWTLVAVCWLTCSWNLRVQSVKESSSTGILMHQGTNLSTFGSAKDFIVCVYLLSDLYYLTSSAASAQQIYSALFPEVLTQLCNLSTNELNKIKNN